MRKIFISFLLFSTVSAAAGGVPAIITKEIPGTKIDSVREVGKYLFEIEAGGNVIYMTKDGYLIIGTVYKNGKNITKEALSRNAEKAVKKLDLSKAIHIKNGNLKVIAFLDPECPFSQSVWKHYLKPNIDKLDLYLFLYPLPIHKGAKGKSCFVLKSKNKLKALDDVMNGKNLQENCDISFMEREAEKIKVKGVPLLFILSSGTVEKIEGADDSRLSKYLKKKISIKDFDLKAAVKVGSGKGKKVVVITDPLCPFCRKACNELRKYAETGKATFYVYFVPGHGAKSEKAIIYILSQPENKRAKALAEVFEGKVKDFSVRKIDKEAIFKNVKQAVNSGAKVTPTFIFEDGTVIEGAKIKAVERKIK